MHIHLQNDAVCVGQTWLVLKGQKVVLALDEFTDGSLRAVNMLT